MRAAIEKTIPSGILIRDLNGKITYVNPAFCALVGWSEANLIGSKARQVRIGPANTGGTLRLSIKNDGLPFPAVDPFNAGSGLRIMQDQAHLLGAALQVQSPARGGTEVICCLALKDGSSPGSPQTAKNTE